MQYFKQLFAQILQEQLPEVSKQEIFNLIEIPPQNLKADLAFPCFSFAKIKKTSPIKIAESITQGAQQSEAIVLNNMMIVQAGPYINCIFSKKIISTYMLGELGKPEFGQGKHDKTLLIEGRQPNTHKAFHIGHLRNALVSESICRIAKFAGYKITRCSYMGDIGAHVAKWIWYYTKFDNSPLPTENYSLRAGNIYTQAGIKIEENPEQYKQEIHDTQLLLESGDEKLTALWQTTRQGCLDDMKTIFQELGCQIDKDYFESDVEQSGIQLVKELSESKKITEIHPSRGAIIADLEEYGLGVFVLLKSNGTSLYSTKDITLAYLKEQDFKFDESVYIVATEQLHHFNQLFKTLELLGYTGKLRHVAYGMVELESGKMSSRDGTAILYQDMRDTVIAKAKESISDRKVQEDKKDDVARKIAFGAMNFGILLQDSYKKIIFDMKKLISFEGETGPYIQYSFARTCSVLSKYDARDHKIDISTEQAIEYLTTDHDKAILLHIATFPDLIQQSANEYRPNLIARFLLELCHHLNRYYHHNYFLDEKSPETSASRILLLTRVQSVMTSAMKLVCIPEVQEM